MKLKAAFNRSRIFEDLIQDLGKNTDQNNPEPIFQTLKDAMIFAACLGFQTENRIPLAKEMGGNIDRVLFENTHDDSIIHLMGIAESKLVSSVDEDSDINQSSIFEEYAHGGFQMIRQWQENNPGDLLDAIFKGLKDSGFITMPSPEEDEPTF